LLELQKEHNASLAFTRMQQCSPVRILVQIAQQDLFVSSLIQSIQ